MTTEDIIQQILVTGELNELYNTPKVTLTDGKNESTVLSSDSFNFIRDVNAISKVQTTLDFGFFKVVIPISKDRFDIEDAIFPQQYNIKLIPLGINSTKYLDESRFTRLDTLTKAELRLRRNEIFARHGQSFSSDDLKEYFSKKVWYQEIPNYKVSDDELSKSELLMIDKIKILESK